MAQTGYAQARAEAKLRKVDRLRAQALPLASGILAKLRTALVRAVRTGRPDISQAVAEAFSDLATLLGETQAAAYLRGYDSAVQEAAEYLTRKARTKAFAVQAPYVEKAVAFHSRRLDLDPDSVDLLRSEYGRNAVQILSDVHADFERETQALVSNLIKDGVHVREGRDRILDHLKSKGLSPSSPWLAESIFRTQLQLAFSAGDYAADQNPAIQEILWGYEYSTVGDDRVRPNHSALDGSKLPKDDPRWDSLRPPNGHACRCMLLKVFQGEEGDGTVSPRPVDGVDPVPDPGWEFNPGRVYQGILKAPTSTRLRKRQETRTKTEDRQAGSAGFPADAAALGALRDLGAAGGSTGARIVEDSDGNRYVLKKGSSPAHLLEEFQAEELYRAAGVPVPDSKLYETTEGPVKLSKWVEGRKLSDLSGDERAAAFARLQDGYAADAFLANWDVVGTGFDNVIVSPDGTPYRIDVGGSLRFRAQGGPKPAFGRHTTELWTLSDSSVNGFTSEAFAGLDPDRKWDQVGQVVRNRKRILDKVGDPTLRGILSERIDELDSQLSVYRDFRRDRWQGRYSDDVVKHSTGLRAAGVVDGLPKQLKPRDRTDLKRGQLVDENGKAFDNFRKGADYEVGSGHPDADTVSGRFEAYLKRTAGTTHIVQQWGQAQSGNSWSTQSYRRKLHLWANREDPVDAYYWHPRNGFTHDTFNNPSAGLPKFTKEELRKLWAKEVPNTREYRESMAALHAMSYETVRNIDLPNNDRANRRIALIRTESRAVLDASIPGGSDHLRRGDRFSMKRGASESFSLMTPVAVSGTHITKQWVPHTRVLGTYKLSRPDQGKGFFLGDDENEITALAHDAEVLYAGPIQEYTGGDTTQTDLNTNLLPPEPNTGPAKARKR